LFAYLGILFVDLAALGSAGLGASPGAVIGSTADLVPEKKRDLVNILNSITDLKDSII